MIHKIIDIPALPSEYYVELLKLQKGIPMLKWFIEENQMVKMDEIIAEYNVPPLSKAFFPSKNPLRATIQAPISGIVTFINKNIDHATWNWQVHGTGIHNSDNRQFINGTSLNRESIQFSVSLLEDNKPLRINMNELIWKGTFNSYIDIKDYAYLANASTKMPFRLFSNVKSGTFDHPDIIDYPEFLADKLISEGTIQIRNAKDIMT